MSGSTLDFPACFDPGAGILVRSCLEELCAVLSRRCGKNIDGVFLTGSLSLGEGASRRVGDSVFLFSDFDLGVVTFGEEERKELTPVLREIEAEFSRGKHNLILSSPVSLPVYTKKDILSQKPKPETIDMANHAKILVGNKNCLSGLLVRDGSRITAAESIALIENRARECVKGLDYFSSSSEEDNLKGAYLAGKSILDCVTSILAFRGMYVSGYGRRLEVLLEAHDSESGELGSIMPKLKDEARFWTAFRKNPEIAPVRRRYGTAVAALKASRELMSKVWFWECCPAGPGTGHIPYPLAFNAGGRPAPTERMRTIKKAFLNLLARRIGVAGAARAFRLSRYGGENEFMRKTAALFFFELPENFTEDWECSDGFLKLAAMLFPAGARRAAGKSGKAWSRLLSGGVPR